MDSTPPTLYGHDWKAGIRFSAPSAAACLLQDREIPCKSCPSQPTTVIQVSVPRAMTDALDRECPACKAQTGLAHRVCTIPNRIGVVVVTLTCVDCQHRWTVEMLQDRRPRLAFQS